MIRIRFADEAAEQRALGCLQGWPFTRLEGGEVHVHPDALSLLARHHVPYAVEGEAPPPPAPAVGQPPARWMGQVDLLEFNYNRARFPDEQLRPYWGKQVAWRADGQAIVASGDTPGELFARLHELGITADCVMIDFVHDPSVSYA